MKQQSNRSGERSRPVDAVSRSEISSALFGDAGAVAAQIQRYVDAGAAWIILALRAPFELDALARLASEVVSALRPLRA